MKKAKAFEKCKAFATLDTKSISEIVDNMVYREMEGVICKEGDPANELYIIIEGSCRVDIQGKHVSAIFEENAKRNATVTGNIKALVMPRLKWNLLLKSKVLSPACVDAIKAVREERYKMNIGITNEV